MDRYEHRQQTTWMYWVAIVLLAMFMLVTRTEPRAGAILAAAGGLVAIAIAIFSRLTVVVDEATVSWAFGWGWPRAELPLREIASVEITETSLVEGFGIHWTIWHGWLWNVGGFQAVEITKINGARIAIGTDDPTGLYDAIVAHRKHLSS